MSRLVTCVADGVVLYRNSQNGHPRDAAKILIGSSYVVIDPDFYVGTTKYMEGAKVGDRFVPGIGIQSDASELVAAVRYDGRGYYLNAHQSAFPFFVVRNARPLTLLPNLPLKSGDVFVVAAKKGARLEMLVEIPQISFLKRLFGQGV